MSILLQQKNVGDYSYMSSPNIYYRAYNYYNNVIFSTMGIEPNWVRGKGPFCFPFSVLKELR